MVEEIVKKIEEETARKIKNMMIRCDKAVEKIMANAREKVEKERKRIQKEVEKTVNTAWKRAISSANLEGKRLVLEAMDNAVRMAIERAKEKLSSLDEKTYASFLERKIAEGREMLGSSFRVYCREKDMALVRRLCERHGCEVLRGDIEIGGVIIESKDRGMKINYTFEEIIARSMPSLREVAAKHLGEGG
ncbi:MAG: hypothetical protein DRN20_00575 [Thermoplasmata archaeon]|nr:MAG: hypothetical protein DRN20_00575 [Thermoplasmata archaeon]